MKSFDIPAVILAGGRSRRMGVPDKCLLALGGKPIIEHVIDGLAPQVTDILINTNSDPEKFRYLGLPVAGDPVPGFQGPLAGILMAMLWARQIRPSASHVVTVPADVPFLPENLVARLCAALHDPNAEIAIASQAGRWHPTIAVWPVALAGRLARDLLHTDVRKVRQWLRSFRVRDVEFCDAGGGQFLNINTADDLHAASLSRGAGQVW